MRIVRARDPVSRVGWWPRLASAIAYLTVAAIVGPFGTPARADPVSDEMVTAVFINPGKRGEVFWDMVVDTMRAAARGLQIDLEVVYAERSYRTMQAQAYAVIARPTPPKLMVLSNEDDAGVPILEAADAAGIRTLLISNDVVGKDRERLVGPRVVLKHWLGTLMADMRSAGARMATRMLENAREKKLQSQDGLIHMLVLGGDERTPSWIERREGLMRIVATQSDVVIDRELLAHWNAAEAEDLTRRYLAWAQRKGIRVGAVWAGNDPMALGAMKALREAGLTPGRDTVVVGLNWSLEALEKVKTDEMLLTDGGHFLLGAWSMIMLRDYIDGCDALRYGSIDYFPTAAITRDNADFISGQLASGGFSRIDVQALRAKVGASCRPYDFSLPALLGALGAPDGK